MRLYILQAIAVFLLTLTPIAQATVGFDWATVGNPGNHNDAAFTNRRPTGFGSVDYIYRISKHEVTNAQYTEFLNLVDPNGTNDLELYNPSMSLDEMGGIDFHNAAPSGGKYKVKQGRTNNPVVFVSFFDGWVALLNVPFHISVPLALPVRWSYACSVCTAERSSQVGSASVSFGKSGSIVRLA